MDRKTTSLCLLVWNERQGCAHDLPRIDFSDFDEVFAIDGGSEDGTVEVLQKYGVTVHPQKVRSLNAAYWEAVEISRCDRVVVFFPKGTIDPGILPVLKRRLDSFDLAIASRLGAGARNEEDARILRPRKWGIRALALFAALVWRREGAIIWDVLHGVKGFSKHAFRLMNIARVGVSVDLEMVVRAYRLRLKRSELPVIEVARSYGQTKFRIFPTALKLAAFLRKEVFKAPAL